MSIKALSIFAALTTSVAGHGFVQYIVANGKNYTGWDPGFRYQNPPPSIPGWTADNPDIGFVGPDSFAQPDIICHKSATPGQAYVEVTAGSTMTLQWFTWPDSHKGPIIDYLADCGSSGCTSVKKEGLKFVKIAQSSWKSGQDWATDDLIHNQFKWQVKIPANLKPGQYVLRHEIIALHGAFDVGGAQAYPQCINLHVSGSGSKSISGGVPATNFYKADDPGIHFDIYGDIKSYPNPGPDNLWKS
ncbi:glycoside hydrolase [Hypoxylon trugodes]|uniref:glycoside hydrolase n=1 Tax=Hypoxylon trugodes TaxID=326681 RepID=UPI002193E9C1|nr:glycoside hydrolase [Hypoxylon trugodes]KAI1383481.1 glycoside hydrolase [Hypoxylon trugodes]